MNAETNWTSAKAKAVVASHDFTAPVLLNPSARLKAVPAGLVRLAGSAEADRDRRGDSEGGRDSAPAGRRWAGGRGEALGGGVRIHGRCRLPHQERARKGFTNGSWCHGS